MKTLTVCQPFASLIALPDDHPRRKRVENRKWGTGFRGPLAIHAGKNRTWLRLDASGTRDREYDLALDDMPMGAVVAVADVVGCTRVQIRSDGEVVVPDWALAKWPWLALHEHTEGPYCFVLDRVRALAQPVPCSGAQGFWNLPPGVESEVRRQLSGEAITR